MPTTLIVASLIALVLALAATVCAFMAPRLPMAIRIVAAVVFVPLALFCLFGFAAAMEPGDGHVIWRVGYIILLIACLLAIGRLCFARRLEKTLVNDQLAQQDDS